MLHQTKRELCFPKRKQTTYREMKNKNKTKQYDSQVKRHDILLLVCHTG